MTRTSFKQPDISREKRAEIDREYRREREVSEHNLDDEFLPSFRDELEGEALRRWDEERAKVLQCRAKFVRRMR